MENFVTVEDEIIENTIGHMEDINIKREVDDFALDIVKHELPLNEIKYEIHSDIEDNNRRLDNKLSEKILIHPILEKSETNQDKSNCDIINHVLDSEESDEMCEKSFTENLNFTVHKQTHTHTKEQCECVAHKKIFGQFSNLSKHLCTHTEEEPYEYEICHRSFTRNERFNSHVQNYTEENLYKQETIHTRNKSFECNICAKSFNQSSTLIAHTRIHTGEKPFECNICEKSFIQRNILVAHKRTHTGEKPFECNVCERKFKQRSALISHKRTHTGEKPYACNICQKSFKQGSGLITHKRIHTKEKPFKCNMCEKRFSHSSTLINHKRIHTRKKPFEYM